MLRIVFTKSISIIMFSKYENTKCYLAKVVCWIIKTERGPKKGMSSAHQHLKLLVSSYKIYFSHKNNDWMKEESFISFPRYAPPRKAL